MLSAYSQALLAQERIELSRALYREHQRCLSAGRQPECRRQGLGYGAALYAADLAYTLKEGVELAHDALHTGLAREKLEELGAFTAIFKQENEA